MQQRFVDRQGGGLWALTASLREVAILDEQKLVLGDHVAARLVSCWEVFAGDGIDEPALKRWPVRLFTWRKETLSAAEASG